MSNISNLEDYRTPTPNTENSKVTNTRKYKDVREREYLTSSEIERISKAAKSIGRHGHRDSTTIMIAYHYALRVSELVNLKWSQVDLTQGLIHVSRLKNGVASVHPLSGQNIRALRKLKGDYLDTQYIFITTRGNNQYYFTYDNNGNMLTGNGLTQTIYNKDNKATKLVKNGTTSIFAYGADGKRFKQVNTTGSQTTTTYYVGKGFEREITTGGHIMDKTFVQGHTTLYKTVAGAPNYPSEIVHNLLDRLGSPSTLISGGSGTPTVIRYRAHGVFGRPIDAGSGSILANAIDWDSQTRGFTGHEHMVEQALINMNGRIYDYNLGRFMSVDPLVQAPTNSQSLNPYSYIMNNPLSGTDPTGYCSTTDTMKDCAGGLEEGKTQAITNSDGKTVGHIGKDSQGNVHITNNGASKGQTAVSSSISNVGKPQDIGSSAQIAQTDSASSKEPDNISNKVTTRADMWDNPEKASINGGDITISANVYNASDSGLSNEHVDAELAAFNKEFSGEVEGIGNLKIQLIRVADAKDADVQIVRCDYMCGRQFKAETGKNVMEVTAFVQGAGRGDKIYVNPVNYGKVSGTLKHEIGHYLGMRHQQNSSKSIMSYNHSERSITAKDRRRLYDGYRTVLKKY